MTSDLITRLSKLDAPDREVDAEIWLTELQSAEGDPFGGYGLAEDWRYEYEAEEDGSVIQYARNGQVMHKIGRRSSPAFTASVDAVIARADREIPGWEYILRRNFAELRHPSNPKLDVRGHAFNTATAACIALLRAKEASHGE